MRVAELGDLGGALGAALLEAFLARGWILRMPRSRAVNITPKGSDAFARLFNGHDGR
jgi:hypothetical protein